MIDCVDWKVDHQAKTITVTIRIDFYDTDPSARPADTKGLVDAWVREIEARWQGKFKCYDFRVKVDAGIVSGFKKVRSNALDVAIDPSMGEPQTMTPGPRGKAVSDDPADSLHPERSDPPSWWSDDTGSYTAWGPFHRTRVAHEVGHVLGLDDGYYKDDKGVVHRVEGHPDDIMYDPKHPVTAETITRVVRRHGGPPIEDQIKCPLTLEAGPSDFNLLLASLSGIKVHAYTCDYDPPSSDPSRQPKPAKFKGTMHAAGEYLKQLNIPLSASGSTDFPVTFSLPIGQKDGSIAVDAQVWVLRQKLLWDDLNGVPTMLGPFVVHARDHGSESSYGLDSSAFWPGPPLYGVFTHGAKECQ